MNLQSLNSAVVMMGVIVWILGLVGCGSTQQEMRMFLQGTNRLNLAESGQPLPIAVRIYTLRDVDRFQKATFQELWKQDVATLGEDLLHRKDLTLNPEETHKFEVMVDREKEERFFGIMALFRQYQGGTWRMVIPIEEKGFFSIGAREFAFQLTEQTIRQVEPD